MGFDEGQIILDSENGAYFAGQTVYGRMVFDQEKVKTIHGIYVDMKGFCKVHWTSQRTRRVNNRTEFYSVSHDAFEEYFNRKTYIFGSSDGEHHLQPGHHELRFDCPIPANCPSTYEHSHGHIRYRIKVVMVTSGIFSSNKTKMAAVRVHAPLDLNQNPYCKEPIDYELLSTYCCCCVSSGSSEVLVKLPVGGYCPGQVIPIEVNCKNPSSVDIDKIKFTIKKNLSMMATSEPATYNDHDTVAEITKGPIPAGTTRFWTLEMEVPAMDLYNVNACRFIDIDYHFKVSTEVDGCHEGAEDTHPIIFGTIPLVGYQDNVQNPLSDQLPKPMVVQDVQGVNCYPPPPIMNQPLPNSPYPNGNLPPYPAGNPAYTSPSLGSNQPFSPGNQSIPMSPYPPNPNVSPYPPNQPYSGGNSPYPGGNPPYPGGNPPYPGGNPPYPGGNPPYPGGNPPYPGVSPYPPAYTPYPVDNGAPVDTTALKTGTLGFAVPNSGNPSGASVPLLPAGANVPYATSPATNPYATASAPEPSTPGSDAKNLDGPPENSPVIPPYNPDFIKEIDEKRN